MTALDRLDPDAIAKVSGPRWAPLKEPFLQLSKILLSVADDARGELTTIYVKYKFPVGDSMVVYAVAWIKKSSEILVGLALPQDIVSPRLEAPPKDRIYANLTHFLTITPHSPLPPEFGQWAKAAYANLKASSTAAPIINEPPAE